MVFWILALIMVLACVASVLYPLLAGEPSQSDASDGLAASANVLKTQMDELDRDKERGIIGAEEADAARIEIARRLLALNKETKSIDKKTRPTYARPAAIIFALGIPACTLGFYAMTGSPSTPDMPIAGRISEQPAQQDLAAMVAQVERRLATNPDDTMGWRVIAPVYRQMGDIPKAITAYENALRIGGHDAADTTLMQVDLGELYLATQNLSAVQNALPLFEAAIKAEPETSKPKFLKSVALSLLGDTNAAVKSWQGLIDEHGASNPPWLEIAKEALKNQKAALAGDVSSTEEAEAEGEAPQPLGNPDAQAIEDANELDADDRQQMIEGMVEGLAARLEETPNDPQGWARLIRSYGVLGKPDAAKEALERARAIFKDNTEALKLINAEIEE